MRTLITAKNYEKYRTRLEELLIRCWFMSSPMIPKMNLTFKVSPVESYFSTVGEIWFVTPFWRGEAFARAALFHEGFHFAIYPTDLFRALKDAYQVRRMLAEEEKFQPKEIIINPWRKEEDWSKFKYSLDEIIFLENILGDWLVNLHIHDNYPSVWADLWSFLSKEGTFYSKEKAFKRDTSFMLYLAVYPLLLHELPEIPLVEESSKRKLPQIASLIKDCRTSRISTTYTLKELVKLFHEHVQQDIKEGEEKRGKEGLKCPVCSHEDWEIIEYEGKDGKWHKT